MASRRGSVAGRWITTAAALVLGGALLAGPAVGQAADEKDRAADEAVEAVVANEGSAYSVSVSGSGASLSARPGAKTKSCPDDQVAALASSDAAPFLTTGALDVQVACTSATGSLRSRAVAQAVAGGPSTPVNAFKAKLVAAECSVEDGVTKGAALISGVEAVGKVVGDVKNPEPNTPLSNVVPGLSGVINEQVQGGGRISVNALRVNLGAVEMIIGHVECGAGASDVAFAKGAQSAKGATTTQPEKSSTTAGPTTTKVKGGGKDKGSTTTVATGSTTTAKPTSTTKAGTGTTRTTSAKGGKSLAKTGPVTGALLVLAAAALGMGALLRLGSEGLPALALARRARERARHPRRHRPAATWSPRSAGDTDDGRLDAAARDALEGMDG